MTTYLSPNFTLAEFASASDVQLTAPLELRAQYFASNILQPARSQFGWPLKITSFVRSSDTSSAHVDGSAVDFQPCRACPNPPDATEFARRLEILFTWLAQHKASEFGTLIHERNHLHVTRPGAQGRTGVVLREPTEGEYVLADIPPIVLGGGVALLGLALWAFTRKQG